MLTEESARGRGKFRATINQRVMLPGEDFLLGDNSRCENADICAAGRF